MTRNPRPASQGKKKVNQNLIDAGIATRFKKGKSGNPAGPPLARINLWHSIRKFSEMSKADFDKMDIEKLTMSQSGAYHYVKSLSEGEWRNIKEALDREDGSPTQKIDLKQTTTQISQEVASMDEDAVNNRIRDIASAN